MGIFISVNEPDNPKAIWGFLKWTDVQFIPQPSGGPLLEWEGSC